MKKNSVTSNLSIPYWNGRRRALAAASLSILLLLAVSAAGMLLQSKGTATNLAMRNLVPSLQHLFGTDWLGRDMFVRTISGLALSIKVGLLGAISSVFIAFFIGLAAAVGGRRLDRVLNWLIDLFMSIPHLVLLILIAFVCGGGMKGIVIGIMATHWPSLARVVRAEAQQLLSSHYVKLSRQLGRNSWWIASRHIAPHVLPQVVTGFLLMFPHAILHEAAITFLGLGLSPHQPAIGVILSESMRYLSTGMWWLALFPGLGLLIVVRSFDRLGEAARVLLQPRDAHH